MARPILFLVACLLVSTSSCSLTRHSIPAGSFTILVRETSVTEFFGIAEAAAKDIGYVRSGFHDQQMMSLMANTPERSMTLRPGPIDDLYEVGTRVWRDSDGAKGCEDLLAMHRSLRRAYPYGAFISFDGTCPGLNKSSTSPSTPVEANASLQKIPRKISVGLTNHSS